MERHIRKMRKVYMKRREVLRRALNHKFGQSVKILGDSTGLHLIAEFKGGEFTKELIERLYQSNVKVYPVEHHTIQKGRHVNKVILGYGNLREEEIEEGVCRLRTIVQKH
ncbi:GntR family transcriptional regulator [Peribacillus asahii]|uniref:GntR family transcriptional regulator n=2 Tax=Peribacillus asahii TaxID=228899 RepID=A0A3T0KRM5_9BACI|nr:GntR family transcriptional regulator [Peribacillus asahii]